MGNYCYYYTIFKNGDKFAAVYRGEKEQCESGTGKLINLIVDTGWTKENGIQVEAIFGHFSEDIIATCKSNCVDSALALLMRIIEEKGIIIPEDNIMDLENVSCMVMVGDNKIDRRWSDSCNTVKINDDTVPIEMDEAMKDKIAKRLGIIK